MALAEALASLAGGFGAEAAVLSRHARGEPRPRAIATHDAQASDPNAAMLRRALCGDVLGFYYPKALASTIWFLTDHLEDANWQSTGTLENWRTARGIREIVIVVIAASLQQRDYLEFHFTRELAYSEKLELETLMPTLVRAWSGRKTGLVTQVQMDDRMVRARAAAEAARLKPDAPILGMSNPARLSRAEFRVCLLLSRGLSVRAMTEELGLTESTVRSHLRSIYSKTEVSGIQELMYRILSSSEEEIGRALGRA